MNIFMVLGDELVTPALGDTILAGITRAAVLTLARERYGREVIERSVALEEVVRAAEAGSLKEVFIASTALQLRPVSRIVDGDKTVNLPDETPLTERLYRDLVAIQHGEAEDPWGWITTVPVTGS